MTQLTRAVAPQIVSEANCLLPPIQFVTRLGNDTFQPLHERLDQIVSRAAGNQQALQIADADQKSVRRLLPYS